MTSLGNPTYVGPMRNPAVIVGDRDHFTQEWTWREKGKDKDGRRKYGGN